MYKYPKGSSIKSLSDIKGKRITVMGLGLNGGGVNSVKFLLEHGGIVTATDLKTKEDLSPSISEIERFINEKGLDSSALIYHLGAHEIADFTQANCVIKNPVVNFDKSEYLQAAVKAGVPVESDLSIFLSLSPAPVIAVTGSKGKSTTASAIYFGLKQLGESAFLGGNITVSPLTFLSELTADTPVVLELSSWQLRDLFGCALLKPTIAVITKIARDHQNWYSSMTEYVRDKSLIYGDMGALSAIVLDSDEWGDEFARHCKKRRVTVYRYDSKTLSPRECNLNCAALALQIWGYDEGMVRDVLMDYKGLSHREEHFFDYNGASFIDDSTATIPEAAIAALQGYTKDKKVILIAGGTDKALVMDDMARVIKEKLSLGAIEKVYLLKGSATNKLLDELKALGCEDALFPIYDDLSILVGDLKKYIDEKNTERTILFSPGATSFELFSNEFDRGDKFKAAVKEIFEVRG